MFLQRKEYQVVESYRIRGGQGKKKEKNVGDINKRKKTSLVR